MNSKIAKTFNIIGNILLPILILINAIHLVFTILLAIEQANTGFGFGTSWELGVLYPWLFEVVFCLLPIGMTIVYLCNFDTNKKNKVAILILMICLVLQILLVNLFIFV